MKKYSMLMTPDNAQKTHDGAKTVTRRPTKPQPPATHTIVCDCETVCQPHRQREIAAGQRPQWRWYHHTPVDDDPACEPFTRKPAYKPGDIVSIKEYHWRWGFKKRNKKGNWQFVSDYYEPVCDSIPEVIFSSPNDKPKTPEAIGYHGISGLFLPFHLAKTHVEILGARPEELQKITEADVWAEGLAEDEYYGWLADAQNVAPPGSSFEKPIDLFEHLWDSIYGATYPWAGNWWVWRYEYKRVEKP